MGSQELTVVSREDDTQLGYVPQDLMSDTRRPRQRPEIVAVPGEAQYAEEQRTQRHGPVVIREAGDLDVAGAGRTAGHHLLEPHRQ